MRRLASAFCFLALCDVAALQAQTPTATVSGIVKDSQGSVIQGA
jgi:hypothetical protein